MSTFAVFSRGGHEYVLQTLRPEGGDEVEVLFTSGQRSWTTLVKAADRSKSTVLEGQDFLKAVVEALIEQEITKYDFELHESPDGSALDLAIKVRVDQGGGTSIAVNMCRLHLKPCDDHASLVRSMLNRLIGTVHSMVADRGTQAKAYKRLEGQLAAANDAVHAAVTVAKDMEAQLIKQFVTVLNTKKAEIARLQHEADRLKERLAAERARVASGTLPAGVTASPAAPSAAPGDSYRARKQARRRSGSSSNDSQSSEDTDPGFASDREERKAASADTDFASKALETLPLASLDQHYEPGLANRHAPQHRRPPAPSPRALGISSGSTGLTQGSVPPPSVHPSASTVAPPSSFDLIDAALEEDDDALIAATTRPRVIRRSALANRGTKRGATAPTMDDGDNTQPPESQLTIASTPTPSNSQKRATRSASTSGTQHTFE